MPPLINELNICNKLWDTHTNLHTFRFIYGRDSRTIGRMMEIHWTENWYCFAKSCSKLLDFSSLLLSKMKSENFYFFCDRVWTLHEILFNFIFIENKRGLFFTFFCRIFFCWTTILFLCQHLLGIWNQNLSDDALTHFESITMFMTILATPRQRNLLYTHLNIEWCSISAFYWHNLWSLTDKMAPRREEKKIALCK